MHAHPITVLMATCNGAPYLEPQLHSITTQSRLPAQMIISDDGSTDETPHILRLFANSAPFPVTLIDGPQNGVAQNLLVLQARAPAGHVAFADQDDVWLPDKLARGADALSRLPANRPALYTARRIITDANLTPCGTTKHPHRAPCFANALVQNIAPGNTIMLNSAAVTLAQSAATALENRDLPFHDWWLYQLLTGAGGQVIYDRKPALYYRQHGENFLGAGRGVIGRIIRIKTLFDGTYGAWLLAQAKALECSANHLTGPAYKQLCQFLSASNRRHLRVYRQSLPEQFLLRLALTARRV